MQEAFSRMEILLGKRGTDLLGRSKVAVFGIGGAGSYVVEALARCGIGSLTLVDQGMLQKSNINRQLYALPSTVGISKVEAAKTRVHQIDDQILVKTYETYFNEDTVDLIDFGQYHYVVDVTDTVASKLLLIKKAKEARVPVISCLELGNRLDADKLEVVGLEKARTPMGKMMQMELRQHKIDRVKVLCSRERPPFGREFLRTEFFGKRKYGKKEAAPMPALTGSISYIYGIAGMRIAAEVVRDLLKNNKQKDESR